MLKKTSVYLDSEDKKLLKKLAATKQMTFSEALRYSIRQSCKPSNPLEQKFWDSIDLIWANNRDLDPDFLESEVDKAVKEVRSARAKTRRSA